MLVSQSEPRTHPTVAPQHEHFHGDGSNSEADEREIGFVVLERGCKAGLVKGNYRWGV